MLKPHILALLVLLGCTLCCQAVTNSDYRLTMSPLPADTFKAMLDNVQQKKYDKIPGLLKSLEKVLAEIKEQHSQDLEKEITTAVNGKNGTEAVAKIQKALYYDIKCVFENILNAKEEQPAKLKLMLQTAYDDYILLSADVKKKNVINDSLIKKAFMKALSILRVEQSALSASQGTKEEVNFEDLENIFGLIQDYILTSYLEFGAK